MNEPARAKALFHDAYERKQRAYALGRPLREYRIHPKDWQILDQYLRELVGGFIVQQAPPADYGNPCYLFGIPVVATPDIDPVTRADLPPEWVSRSSS